MSTWEQSGQKHLATERVRPLSDVLVQQSDIQVCLGLRTILCSLIFLIEKAMARHLNICIQSVYVTDKGSWRLAGFEFVWKAKELNKQLLELAHSFRQPSSIDPKNTEQAMEQFAFATLCEHILDKCKSGNTATTPHVQEFREYCNTHLKHQKTELRPRLSAVLLHPYFNHEFVLIHSFLFELPLKSVQERQHFFSSLIERLRSFDEQVVASQLASDLLSRMVLLDPTAQHCVTPFVLRTKTENGTTALFSPQTYVEYLLPHVLKMFRLRDAQIRLILLDYFMEYVRLLSDEQLLSEILPHLQLGMSDTNDILVAKTLRALADLVPILGAATVLGGDRRRCFSDGRPHAAVSTDSSTKWTEPRSITPLMNGNASDAVDYMVSGSPLPVDSNVAAMPLRLSPDGGEDDKSEKPMELQMELSSDSSTSSAVHERTIVNEDLEQQENDEEAWSDWDNTDELQRLHVKQQQQEAGNEQAVETSSTSTQADSFRTAFSTVSTASTSTTKAPPQQLPSKHKLMDDLSALDIQVQLTTPSKTTEAAEFDFFKDMAPIITETKPASIEPEIVHVDESRFAASSSSYHVQDTDGEADHGWGHDDDDEDDVVWGNAAPTQVPNVS